MGRKNGSGGTKKPKRGEKSKQGAHLLKIKAKSANQQDYLDSIQKYPITFGIGPAGTGKTFLACFAAAHRLIREEVRRIILVRPAIEAGERLGFLPGKIEDKLDPYLRPLYDALNDLVGFDQTKDYVKDNIIEIVPLGYMRGRTLNDSFVILDEGQNITEKQMKMFLTRMGNGSKFVINGDITQIDLKEDESGLIDVVKRLENISGINFVHFEQGDIVRHPVVQKIVEAYDID